MTSRATGGRDADRLGADRPTEIRAVLAADLHDGTWGSDTLVGIVESSRTAMREGSVTLTEWNLLVELQARLRHELDVRRGAGGEAA